MVLVTVLVPGAIVVAVLVPGVVAVLVQQTALLQQ